MLDILGRLQAAVSEVVAADLSSVPDGELAAVVVALQRIVDRVESAATKAAGEFDARRLFDADSARTAAAWLAWRTRLPVATCRSRVRLARQLRHLPAAGEAWEAGRISSAHVRMLAAARRPETEEALARDEAMLVGFASTMRFDHYARSVAYWQDHADPDGTRTAAEAHRARRHLHLSHSLGGVWFGDLRLDPVAGTVVHDQLTRIADELYHADMAEAAARLGRPATPADLGRTPAQRRADALVEMAVRSATAPAGGQRPAPLFSVLVDYPGTTGRICELADGTVVTPADLAGWLPHAVLERVVFDGPSRVIDVGAQRRLFTGGLRRAIEVRDRRCYHPACFAGPGHLQVDHVVPYSQGGPTTQDNARLACGYHNRRRHPLPPPGPPARAAPPGGG